MSNEAQTEAGAFTTAVTKYYYFGGRRVAMHGPDETVVWLHGDHLGSTSLATDAARAVVSRQLYYPFGETRWTSVASLPTDFQFTGQRIQSTIALYDYHARFYDPYLNRFVSPDTIVPSPGNPQTLNRYSYVENQPLQFSDPTGHERSNPGDKRSYLYPQLASVSIRGAWTWEDRQIINRDTGLVASRLASVVKRDQFMAARKAHRAGGEPAEYAELLPLWGLSPDETFQAAFGEETFRLDTTGGLGCNAFGANVITCGAGVGGSLSKYRQTGLIIHELGHEFDQRAGRPSNRLGREEITDAIGAHVTGFDPILGRFDRTNLGYRSNTLPDQQHPLNWRDALANTAGEDYADMFMNWVQNSFAADVNRAGAARYRWMTTNMAEWIAAASR